MAPEIVVAQDGDAPLWDKIVEESPHGTIFHTWDWLKISEKHTSSRLIPLIFYDKDTLLGLMPIFLMKKYLLSMAFSPPPYTAQLFLGPIIIDYEKEKQHVREEMLINLRKKFDDYMKNFIKPDYISLSLPPGLHDPRPFQWADYRISHAYDYVTDVSKGTDFLWKQLSRKLRGDLNRAINRGISVKMGDREGLKVVYNMMVQRYAEQGKTVHVPDQYLFDLLDRYPENMKIFIAEHEGEILTGSIDVFYKNEVTSWIGNPKPSVAISPSPNDLVNWEVIKHASEKGFKSYSVCGAGGNERLHKYYSAKFNPELRIRFNLKKANFIANAMDRGYHGLLKPFIVRMRVHSGSMQASKDTWSQAF